MGNNQSLPAPKFLYYDKLKTESSSRDHRIGVLLIDPQNDFVLPTGSLSVPGAMDDCDRIAESLKGKIGTISQIYITLDTHQKYHIAHALFWINKEGNRPTPFSLITEADVKNGVWFAENPEHREWAKSYVSALKTLGRFQLTIWPEHCLVGSQGHAVYDPLLKVVHEWEKTSRKSTHFVLKGNNAFTEHYSAVKAEVEMKEDPLTHLNKNLIEDLFKNDKVVIAGEALSHCVNFTVRDLIKSLSKEQREKIVIISDGCSSVPGFEQAGKDFITDMKKQGIRFALASEAF